MTRGSDSKRLSNAAVGLIVAIILGIGAYLAFTKAVPWGGGTEYQVVFNSAQNLRVNSPVRIAGVQVGEVKSVEPLAPDESEQLSAQTGEGGEGVGDAGSGAAAALATLEIQDEGLPLKEDARFKLKPRLFLEGNLFVDVNPGSPGSAAQDEDVAFSPDQTSNSVQLDQVLTGALQQDSRADLQVFLDEFGKALIDGGGAESFRTVYKTSPGAFRSTAQVNEALLGQNPHDLSGLIKNLDRVVRGLGRNESALQDLIVNLRVVSGSFAAQDAALEEAIVELPQVLDAADPAFTNLNAAFPPLRAFSREILPGVRSAPETLDAATPLLKQVRLLSRKQELRGLARDLVPTVPNLAKLVKVTPNFLEEARALSSCFNQVIIPWSLDEVEGGAGYPYPAVGPVYKETAYGLAGIAGESRSQDANGQYIRVAGGGGPNTVTTVGEGGETLAGVTQFPIDGAMPATSASAKTPIRPNQPCENQEAPNLNGGAPGTPPDQSSPPVSLSGTDASGEVGEISSASEAIIGDLAEAAKLRQDGEKAAARKLQRKTEKTMADLRKEYGG